MCGGAVFSVLNWAGPASGQGGYKQSTWSSATDQVTANLFAPTLPRQQLRKQLRTRKRDARHRPSRLSFAGSVRSCGTTPPLQAAHCGSARPDHSVRRGCLQHGGGSNIGCDTEGILQIPPSCVTVRRVGHTPALGPGTTRGDKRRLAPGSSIRCDTAETPGTVTAAAIDMRRPD